MEKRLLELTVRNFRSLADVTIPLGDVNVLVGPNGVGKTNVLKVFEFLADIIRVDLELAIAAQGGFDHISYRGSDAKLRTTEIGFKALWTSHSSLNAPDEYTLKITPIRLVRRRAPNLLTESESNGTEAREITSGFRRTEEFKFKRTSGRGRRITVSGQRIKISDVRSQGSQDNHEIGIRSESSGLSTLPRLSDPEGAAEVAAVAATLAEFRVFDVSVNAARLPARMSRRASLFLENDASNLAFFLLSLRQTEPEAWDQLVEDARRVLPQLEDIEFTGSPAGEVVMMLRERGLRTSTSLSDASYGTIRILGLLALLYDPHPAAITCVEEIDHGLHPQALELLVERVREASARTQFIIATHSPALADRLRVDELIVCERRETGASLIPAIPRSKMQEIVDTTGNEPLGELWFSGLLGGDLL